VFIVTALIHLRRSYMSLFDE